MLVNGLILMGTMKQSYANTVGFVVSARVENRDSNKLSTRYMLSSLLSSNKFSLSARRSLALYDFYRRITTSQKSDKATRIAVKTTGARLFLSSTPPHLLCKINQLITLLNLNCHPLSEERARLGVYELVKTTKMPYSDCKQSSGMTGLLSGMTIKDWLKGGCYDK